MIATSTARASAADARLLAVFFRDALAVQKSILGVLKGIETNIVKRDIDALEAHMAASEEALQKMEAFESNQVKILSHLERVCGVDISQGGVETLLAAMPEGERPELEKARAEVRLEARKVRLQSARTGLLARQAGTFDRELVESLFSVTGASPVYGADGVRRRQVERIMDRSL